MPSDPDCLRWFFRVPRDQIGYVRFVVESYEGLAQVTASAGRAEVEWIVPASLASDARQLSQALRREVGLVPIERPEDP